MKSEIGAAVIWIAISLLLAAVIAPHLRHAGLNFAAYAANNDTSALVKDLGESCGRAKFSRYFNRSLMLSALALMPLLFRRIRAIRSTRETANPHALLPTPWKSRAAQVATGFAIAAALLLVTGIGLELAGAFEMRQKLPSAGKFLNKTLIPAIAAPLLEEWLFRGVLLGLWLRFSKPVSACIGTSLLFAFVHFLKPPAGSEIANPDHALAGFELLGKILLHFTDPNFFVTEFAVLAGIGLILAWTRLRTRALWFAIGLHAGWIAAFKGFNLIFTKTPDSFLRPWGIGDGLNSGAIPLAALCLTAYACHHALKPFSRS